MVTAKSELVMVGIPFHEWVSAARAFGRAWRGIAWRLMLEGMAAVIQLISDLRLAQALAGAPPGLADEMISNTLPSAIPCSLATSGGTAVVPLMASARTAAWRSASSSTSR